MITNTVSRTRRDTVLAAARELLEREGRASLTLRRLADALEIRAPSLYKHYRSKEELEAALAAAGFEELGAALAGARDLAELARAYRAYALAHPHLYRLMTEVRAAEGSEQGAGASVVAAVGDPALARAAWAFAHGMVDLELSGRLPAGDDLEAAWAAGIAAFAGTPAPPAWAGRIAVFRSFSVD